MLAFATNSLPPFQTYARMGEDYAVISYALSITRAKRCYCSAFFLRGLRQLYRSKLLLIATNVLLKSKH